MTENLHALSDDELLARTLEVARNEQNLTLRIIAHLEEVARRRLFAARGYSSLFEYAVKALGYSEPAASQRVAAMRLARAVPEARELLERGDLKLSNAAAVERFIRREEKETGHRLSAEVKGEIVAEVSGKSARETERVLAVRSEAVGMLPRSERVRPLTAEHTELKVVADAALMARIERVRELKGAHMTLGEVFARALDAYLEREDPLRKKCAARAPSQRSLPTSEVRRGMGSGRYISVAVRREVARRAGGRCEYLDAKTGRRCEIRSQLQWDHIRPFAHGGPATVANIRQLCPAHQQWAAIRNLGPRVMGRYLP